MIRSLAVVGAAALLSFSVRTPADASVVSVPNVAALQAAINKARPGQRLMLADGVHRADQPIKITKPRITIAARHAGRAVFDAGSTLEVSEEAAGSRITGLTFNGDKDGASLTVSADDVEVDHNTFSNRTNEGVYLQITGPDGKIAQRTKVHHNYFYNHSYSGLNGGESIRLGLSKKQQLSANAVVEHNLFEKANGDVEAISVKSSDNTIRFNTIRDSKGYIVLRHGNRNTVEGNRLFGSGIRFHGNDHRIFNNYVENTGDRAIVFGKGSEADSGPTSTEHDRPDRVTVAFNTLIGTGVVVDSDTGTYPPKDCVFANNVIQGSSSKFIDMMDGASVHYEGNIVWGGSAGISAGYRSVDPKLVRDTDGLLRLSSGSPAIEGSTGSYPYVTRDFDSEPRVGKPDVGADEYR